jgi:hypothetical protein
MDAQRLSAYLLIAGVAVMLVSFVLGIRGIYQTDDLNARVRMIENQKTRWNISQALIAVSALLTAAGFFVLNIWLYGMADPWPHTLGAGAMIIGAISGVIFVYRQTVDPLSTYQGAYGAFESVYYWLAVGGLLFFGVAFLQAGLPTWLGYLTVGSTAIYAIFLAASGVGFATPGLVFFLSLVIGIALLRQ